MTSNQDKLRAAVLDAIQEWSEQNTYACDEWQPLLDAIDALLGDMVATYPHPVVRSTVELEPVEDRGFLICTGHSNNLFQNVQLADWERTLCAQLDEDAQYELAISLRRVNND